MKARFRPTAVYRCIVIGCWLFAPLTGRASLFLSGAGTVVGVLSAQSWLALRVHQANTE